MNLKNCTHGPRDGETWVEFFIRKHILYVNTDTSGPHFRLREGVHVGSFFNSDLINDRGLVDRIVTELIKPDRPAIRASDIYRVNRIVSPVVGGSILAHEMARRIDLLTGKMECSYTLLKKSFNGSTPEFDQVGDKIKKGDLVILLDDYTRTGATLGAMKEVVQQSGGTVLFAAVIVKDSQLEEPTDLPIRALCTNTTRHFRARNCELCSARSPILPDPKSKWDSLFT